MRNSLAALLCVVAFSGGCGKSEPQVVEHKHTIEIKGLGGSSEDDWLKGLSEGDAKEAKENYVAALAGADKILDESDSLKHEDFMAMNKAYKWAMQEFNENRKKYPLEASRIVKLRFARSAQGLIADYVANN